MKINLNFQFKIFGGMKKDSQNILLLESGLKNDSNKESFLLKETIQYSEVILNQSNNDQEEEEESIINHSVFDSN